MSKSLNRFLNVLLAIFILITLALTGFVGYLHFSGLKGFAVISPSMEPEILKGDAVFIRFTEVEELQVGDIITVVSPKGDRAFTHRITRFDSKKTKVYTKGDKNQSEDPMPTDISLVAGKVAFSLPKLGYLSETIGSKVFLALLASSVAALILISSLLSLYKDRKGGKKNGKKQA
ncbi:MAG: signal peptidase I [Clostridiales bacterium]|nr:signal peptidase I [Clostridiales bacterium]